MGLLKGQRYVLILIIVFREVIGKTVNSAENVDVAVLIRCYAGWGRWGRSKFAYTLRELRETVGVVDLHS